MCLSFSADRWKLHKQIPVCFGDVQGLVALDSGVQFLHTPSYRSAVRRLKSIHALHNAKLRGCLIATCAFSWFRVAEWLTHSPTTLEVTGSRPTFGDILEIYFSNRYSLRHGGTKNGLCGITGIDCDLWCQQWYLVKITSIPRWTAIINTRQSSTRTHTLPHCKHHRWWLVLGWVTNVDDHLLLWFDSPNHRNMERLQIL